MEPFKSFLKLLSLTTVAIAMTACGGGSGSSSTNSTRSNVQSTSTAPTQISVAPSSLQLNPGTSFQFSVNVLPNNALSAVTWSVSGAGCSAASCGTVDASGNYVAPAAAPNPPTIAVTATSTADQTKSGSASVTIGSSAQAGGSFTLMNMTTARPGAYSITLLADGRVLIVGGDATGRSAELYDPSVGAFVATGSMITARPGGHSATLLADGRVLIAGGDATGLSAELYDPSTGSFAATGSMINPRFSDFAALLLNNGQVLMVGFSGAQLYDPATGQFVRTGGMLMQQNVRTFTLLASGKVLFAGDIDNELYDPATGSFQQAGAYANTAHNFTTTATLLADGRVLFVGDDPAQLYDPASNAFSVTGSVFSPGIFGADLYSATLLKNGEVLIAGGMNDFFPMAGRTAAAELYDPTTGAFTATSSMQSARDAHAAVLLNDGRVLIVGGDGATCNGNFCEFAGSLASAELYDPSSGTFSAAGEMNVPRTGPQTVLLKTGDVLIIGGVDYCGIGCLKGTVASVELYHPR